MKKPSVAQPTGCRQNPTWQSWRKMIERCYYEWANSYARYGGRGIKVCKRWWVFENFEADMGPRPEGMTLDRKDLNKGYTKSNCRWATRAVQAINRQFGQNTYTNVYWDQNNKAWRGEITVNGQRHRIKSKISEEDAVKQVRKLRSKLKKIHSNHWATHVQGKA